jgi:restriction endonuclease S subunit
LKFVYGFTTKTVQDKQYVYFWKCTGTGRKTEQYMGREGRLRTQRRVLTTKLAYLEGLEQEIQEMIKQTQTELEDLPAEEGNRRHE